MGDIRILRDFWSYPESVTRTLRVYTPDGYGDDPARRYPVLYMMDGQHAFSHPESATLDTWCTNPTLEALVAEGAVEPWIVVALDHTDFRLEEYSPWPDALRGTSGRGAAFVDCVVNHVKPFVDRTWRTRPGPVDTAVMGASLGGLISLVLGRTHPGVFGRIGALSPTVMWADREAFRLWDRPTGRWIRLYLDAGGLERFAFQDTLLDYVSATRDFADHLRSIGLADHELRYVFAPDHDHHERSWAARLPDVLRWLLAPAA